MPLSELLPARRSKLEPNQSKLNSSSDLLSSLPHGEFAENGQIVMQGQSTKPKKSYIPTFSSLSKSLQDRDSGDAVAPKRTRFGATNYQMDDPATAGISGRMEPNMQDDGTNPLLNCSIDDYFLDFLSEFPESNGNSIPSRASTVDEGSNGFSQFVRDSNMSYQVASSKTHPGGSGPGRNKNLQFNQVPQQLPSSISNIKSGASDLVARNCTTTDQNPTWDLLNGKYSRQDLAAPKHPLPPSDDSPGLNNFSHFTRPVALLKSNLQNVGRLNSSEKAFSSTSSCSIGSTVLEPSGGLKSSPHALAPVAAREEIKSTTQLTEELVSVNNSEAFNWKDASQDKNISSKANRRLSNLLPGNNSAFTRDLLGTRHQIEKTSEPVVTYSAVFSGNAAGVVSNDPNHGIKRKIQEGDDSGYQSEDLDDDSTIKKPATAQGSNMKRSRAAEVHNLSERRRRDRINEKMRALQELIPNCNKVDKASMLDEAIEYLKTLQLQVQMMSMGGGLCMPPLMPPPGMQHLLPPQMAHFHPLDVGMGFGMGMLDVYHSPILPAPQFSCSSVPGNQDMPGSTSYQVFGIPGQRHFVPMAAPGSPIFPTLMHSARKSFVPEVPGTKGPVKTAESCLASLEDQQKQNLDSDSNM